MQTLAEQDTRVEQMRQLENIFRSNPDLVREYQQREQDKLDYRLSLEARERRGVLKTLIGLMRQGLLSLKDAATNANMTEDEFTAQMAALGY